MKPTLAIIDIEIRSGQDEMAREGLLTNLDRCTKEYVIPLWVNWLRERADLRVVCLVNDLTSFDDFLIDLIRTVPGVRGTSARLSFGGVLYGDKVMDLLTQNSVWDRRAAATVFVKSKPGEDRAVYQQLVDLPAHQQVEVLWVLKLFHSVEADMVVLLLGERTSSLTGYVMSWIRTIPGVEDTRLTSVLDWQILGDTEDFVATAQAFPEPSRLAGKPAA